MENSTQSTTQLSLESKRIVRLGDVLSLIGLSKSCLYLMIKDGTFPQPVLISGNRVGWPIRVVEEWLDTRPSANIGGAGQPDKYPMLIKGNAGKAKGGVL